MTIPEEIEAEAARAQKRYGEFHSTHEGLGVLVEEYEELREAIRDNSLEAIRIEAIQVAAVALRIAQSLEDEACRERSNL